MLADRDLHVRRTAETAHSDYIIRPGSIEQNEALARWRVVCLDTKQTKCLILRMRCTCKKRS